jgi:hypothetical protein
MSRGLTELRNTNFDMDDNILKEMYGTTVQQRVETLLRLHPQGLSLVVAMCRGACGVGVSAPVDFFNATSQTKSRSLYCQCLGRPLPDRIRF